MIKLSVTWINSFITTYFLWCRSIFWSKSLQISKIKVISLASCLWESHEIVWRFSWVILSLWPATHSLDEKH